MLSDIDLLNMNSVLSIKFLLWTLLMFCRPDPGWTTQAEEMDSLEVKMTNIMDRMTRMEAEMALKDERIAVLEAVMVTKEAIKTRDTKMCELEEEMKSLTGRITVAEETDVLLGGMVDQVRNKRFVFQCAWKEGPGTTEDGVITYDRLTYDDARPGGSGGLDINTGVFTVGQGYSGIWEVSYSIGSGHISLDESSGWLFTTHISTLVLILQAPRDTF